MSLTPTEREEHFFKAMVDAASGNITDELEPTERMEHWYQEIIDAIKAGGGGSGGGGPLVVTINNDDEMDKTWQEIHDAMLSRGAVAVYGDDYAFAVAWAGINEDETYGVKVIGYDDAFSADTPEDYPAVGGESV